MLTEAVSTQHICEELAEYKGPEEIRSVEQSVLRGGDKFVIFKSFNPPISVNNWANEYVLRPLPGYVRHHSTYLQVPETWLGQEFINGADLLKEESIRHYAHEYLGIPTGTGGEIFTNLDIRPIREDFIQTFDNIFMGIDWGWYPDAFQWVKMYFHTASRTLYIYDSYRAYKTSNFETWTYLKEEKGVTGTDLITADSAEKKSVDDYRAYGALCRGAIKGPGSREYSYKWLQSLPRIVIDPERCPEVAKEFREAEYPRDKDGKIISGYPDGNDHSVDAVRYALERYWKRKGQ